MSEQSYPISCQSKPCGKQLYGPVSFCPYCGAGSPDNETAVESPTIEQVTEGTIVAPNLERDSVQQPPTAQVETPSESLPKVIQKVAPEVNPSEQKGESVLEKTIEKPKDEYVPPVNNPPSKPGNLKWIVVVVALAVGIAGYLILHKKDGPSQESTGSKQSTTPTTHGQGNKESARIVALDALRQGTDLSLTISKLPKLEKVLKAAKQLGDISPRYQEQITSAESTISSARTDRDKTLMSYIGKTIEMGRYNPDQVSYAMGVIQSGDISPREKIVVELLAMHVKSLRNNSKADAKKLLSDFNHRFSDFVD